MPQVPYSGAQSVEPNYAPTPSVNVNPPASAFGAATAEAQGRAGAVMERAGDELFQRAYAMQEMDQQADVINAHANAVDQIADKKVEFHSLQGAAAKNALPQYKDDINKIIEENSKGLTSEYARTLYGNQTRVLRSQTIESAAGHAATQFKNYQIGASHADAQSAQKIVGMNPDNEEVFNQQLERISASAKSQGALQGWSPEQVKNYYNDETSKAVDTRARLLAEKGDIAGAQRVLDDGSERGLISGEARGKADQYIRTKRWEVMGRNESQKLVSGDTPAFGSGKVPIDRLYNAIIGVESSGSQYSRVPITAGSHKGEYALGLGQVLQSNLAPWLKEAGMPAMSEKEYLADKNAQMKLIKFKLNYYQEKYGSANKVARHWRGLGFQDPSNGETEPQYLKRFNQKLAGSASSREVRDTATAHAREIAPDDPEFPERLADRTEADQMKMVREENEEYRDNLSTVRGALGPNAEGKVPTSMDDVADPAIQAAYAKLKPGDQVKIDKTLAANSKGEVWETPANQKTYRTWLGKLMPMAGDDAHKEALEADFMGMQDLPMKNRVELLKAQQALYKNSVKNPAVSSAVQAASARLHELGITPKDDEYYTFKGSMYEIMSKFLEDNKRPMKPEEIKDATDQILKDQIISKGFISYFDETGPIIRAEVPEKVATSIKQTYLEKKGREPTDQELKIAYTALQYNEFYGSKKAEPKVGGMVGLRSAK